MSASAILELNSAEQRLIEIEREYERAAQAFDDACAALRQHDLFRVRLSAAQDHARIIRARLLGERAGLLKIVEGRK